MTDKPKKAKKPRVVAYQAIIIENWNDGTFDVRMESGRLEDGKFVPELRKHASAARCDARTAAGYVGDASGRLQQGLRAAAEEGEKQ